MQCIARLHNFILNQNNEYELHHRERAQPVPPAEENGRETNGEPAQPVAGISIVCNSLVKRVLEAGLTRP
jgi:hypothetical protein